jgi:hypothetical protein
MVHYVCSECGTTSKIPHVCQTPLCIQEDTPLSECRCEDGLHEGVMHKRDGEEPQTGNQVNTIDLDTPVE